MLSCFVVSQVSSDVFLLQKILFIKVTLYLNVNIFIPYNSVRVIAKFILLQMY